MRPFITASVPRLTFLAQRMMPSKCAPSPMLTKPATCQTMFLASAPRTTGGGPSGVDDAVVNIQASGLASALPAKSVTPVVTVAM